MQNKYESKAKITKQSNMIITEKAGSFGIEFLGYEEKSNSKMKVYKCEKCNKEVAYRNKQYFIDTGGINLNCIAVCRKCFRKFENMED